KSPVAGVDLGELPTSELGVQVGHSGSLEEAVIAGGGSLYGGKSLGRRGEGYRPTRVSVRRRALVGQPGRGGAAPRPVAEGAYGRHVEELRDSGGEGGFEHSPGPEDVGVPDRALRGGPVVDESGEMGDRVEA